MPLQVLNVTNEVYIITEAHTYPILVTRTLEDAKSYLTFCVDECGWQLVSDWATADHSTSHGEQSYLYARVKGVDGRIATLCLFREEVCPAQLSVEEERALEVDAEAKARAGFVGRQLAARTPEQVAEWKDIAARYLARLKSEGYLTFPEVVRRVLEEAGEPLTAQQIAERAAVIPGCPKYVQPFAAAIRDNLQRAARDPDGGMLGMRLVETQLFDLVKA